MEDISGMGQTLVTGLLGHATPTSTAELPQGADYTDLCVHFWIIETPNGPTSQGICKLCGRAQEFCNSVSSSAWNKGVAK